MEWLNNILRNLERLFTNATEYAYANPKVGYLVVIFLLLVLACRTDIRLEMDIRQTRKLGRKFLS